MLEITEENVARHEELLSALRDDLAVLAEMTTKYPVEVEFRGFRFVFRSKAEIEELIGRLDSEIREYYARAA